MLMLETQDYLTEPFEIRGINLCGINTRAAIAELNFWKWLSILVTLLL